MIGKNYIFSGVSQHFTANKEYTIIDTEENGRYVVFIDDEKNRNRWDLPHLRESFTEKVEEKEEKYIYTGSNSKYFTNGKEYIKYNDRSGFFKCVIDDTGKSHPWDEVYFKQYFKTIYEYFRTKPKAVEESYKWVTEDTQEKEVVDEPTHKGLRYNKGKLRYELLHPVAVEGLVRVLTKGANKYAERNWENGLSFSSVIGCMKRHTAAVERGEDYDKDPNCEDCCNSTKENWICKNHTGELHVDLIQANAHFLSAFYKIYPQGDDRNHKYLATPKIGLDIDEVLCDWVTAWCKKFDMEVPENWFFDDQLYARFEDLKQKGELDDFYLSLQPLIKPEDIPFEPHCYITSRPVSSAITRKWLDLHGFPARPVATCTKKYTKVDACKEMGVEIFVDDSWDNFVALNKAGICCFLMDAKHNKRYDCGYKRITDLKSLI